MKIKLLLLALLFTAIPKGLYAYTNGQIVKINSMNYKVMSSEVLSELMISDLIQSKMLSKVSPQLIL